MSLFTLDAFNNLEQARDALVTDYERQRAQLREGYKAAKRDLLRKPGQARALYALNKQYKIVLRQLKRDKKQKMAAADIWAFEDPECECNLSMAELMDRSRRGQRLPDL